MSRGRPRLLEPTIDIKTRIPASIYNRVEEFLMSDLCGRVPYGVRGTFYVARIKEFFERIPLDLAPFLGTPPETFVIWGQPEVIETLKSKLEGNGK